MPFLKPTANISLPLLISINVTVGMLVLTLVLLGQSYRGLESAKLTAAKNSAQQLATGVEDRMHAIIAPASLALRMTSWDPLQDAATLSDRRDRLPVIARILQQNELVSAVYTAYGNGDFFLLRQINADNAHFFPDAPEDTSFVLQTITEQNFGGKEGTWHYYDHKLGIIHRDARPDYQYDPRERPWYKAAQDPGQTVLTSPYLFFTTGEVGMTIAHRSDLGHTVMGIDVTVKDLSTKLADLRYTPGTQMAIVNQKNEVVAYSSLEILTQAARQQESLQVLGQLTDPALSMIDAKHPENGIVQVNSGDRDYYGLSVPINTLGESKLRVLVAIPADELLADVWASLTQQFKIAAIIAVLLLALGWILGRQLGKPLEHLTNRVGALSRFRFDTSVKINSHIREANKLSAALDDMSATIRSFQAISLALNRGKDLDELLHDVLSQIIHIVGQKRGAIYLYNRNRQRMKLAVNTNLELPERLEPIDAGIDDHDMIQFLREKMSGHPLFAILRNRKKDLIGVLVIEIECGDQFHLSNELIVFVDEIAGSAAVAIETRELIASQQALLDGIIKLVANAIDAKSPYTSGHCNRVPELAKMLVQAAENSHAPPFKDFRMNEDEAYEFHLAAWLHDCGKITSPEYVVDKATKLETIYNRIHEIRTRFEVLHRDAEIEYLRACLDGKDEAAARAHRDKRQGALQEEFAFIAQLNQGGESVSEEDLHRMHAIGDLKWWRYFDNTLGLSHDELERFHQHHNATPETLPVEERLLDDKAEHLEPWGEHVPPVTKGDPRNRWGFDMVLPTHAYNRGERHNLSVSRGTLTPEERFKVNEHIVQTICMLDELPLPDKLSNVPRLAGTHHERLDGEGYPCKLFGDELGIPEKIMVVADIFEALTATDRPYKVGMKLSDALNIMLNMVAEQHVDPDTLRLFIESGVYVHYAETYLSPDQIDSVDVEAMLAQINEYQQKPSKNAD